VLAIFRYFPSVKSTPGQVLSTPQRHPLGVKLMNDSGVQSGKAKSEKGVKIITNRV